MGAAAVAGGAEFADGAADAVRALDREDVAVVRDAADADWRLRAEAGAASGEEKGEGEKGRALQWCSMTRSTMLYSTASSALMK